MPVEIVVGFAVLCIGIMAASAGFARNRNQARTEAELRRVQAQQAQVAARQGQEWQTQDETRRQAVAEAIRRDPSLGGDDSPETLRRLGEATAVILEEFRLKADLAELERQRQEEQRAEAARQQADADRALRVAEAEAAKRIEAERLARMNPARRWILTHKMGTLFIAGALLVVSVLGVEFVKRAQESARIAAAAEAQARADAAVAEAQAAADAAAQAAYTAAVQSCAVSQLSVIWDDATALRSWDDCKDPIARSLASDALRFLEHPVGSTGPGGGTVFYGSRAMQSWGQFLEVAPADWSYPDEDPSAKWCGEVPVAVTSPAIGSGASNTDAIVAKCGKSSAAGLATAYRGGDLDDWVLPSREELSLLDGLPCSSYWSSTRTGPKSDNAWIQVFTTGRPAEVGLNLLACVRPIRAF